MKLKLKMYEIKTEDVYEDFSSKKLLILVIGHWKNER